MTVVLRARAVVLHDGGVAHVEVAVFVRPHAGNACEVHKVRGDVILQIEGATFVDVVGVGDGHAAVVAKVFTPVLQTVGSREVAEVGIRGVGVGVVHGAKHTVHRAKLIDMHVSAPSELRYSAKMPSPSKSYPRLSGRPLSIW